MKKALFVIKNLLSFFFWFLLMVAFSDIKIALQTVSAALLHELGHIFALILLKKNFSLPRLVTSGMRIKTHSSLSYKEEIFICAAGPFVNIFLFFVFLPHGIEFAIINLATAVSNLLPLTEYDGYKIISDTISLFSDAEKSRNVMPEITVAVSSVAVFLSLFLILRLDGGYWIFAIFFTVLVREIFLFQKQAKNENK